MRPMFEGRRQLKSEIDKLRRLPGVHRSCGLRKSSNGNLAVFAAASERLEFEWTPAAASADRDQDQLHQVRRDLPRRRKSDWPHFGDALSDCPFRFFCESRARGIKEEEVKAKEEEGGVRKPA